MDAPYRIEVLHIVNPHVMFVESQTQGAPAIQQVGIYGILPLSSTLDIDGRVSACRGSYWPAHVVVELKEFFAKHKNCLYFVPIQVEERSTIFDENTHTFGDIITRPGKVISLTEYFVKINVAIKDECAFHQVLVTGALSVKLNSIQIEDVLKAIKKYYKRQEKVEHDWRMMINKQTTVYQDSKKMSAKLTEENLRIFQLNLDKKVNVMETIQNKERDFNLCKDADLVSVGCGSRRNRSRRSSSVLKQLPEHDENNVLRPHDMFTNIKKYVEVNARTKGTSSDDNYEHDSEVKQSCQKKESCDNNQTAMKVDVTTNDQHNYHSLDQRRREQKCFSQNEQQSTSYKQNVSYNSQLISKYSSKNEEQARSHHNYSGQDNQVISDDSDCRNEQEEQAQLKEQEDTGQRMKHRTSKQDQSWKISHTRPENSGKQYKQKIDLAQYEVEKVSHYPESKEATTPLKPRTRLVVYCPDMVMSHENTKDLIPKTLVEDFATDPLKPTPFKQSSVEPDKYYHADDDNFIDNEGSYKTNNIDIHEQTASRNKYDTGYQIIPNDKNSETRYQSMKTVKSQSLLSSSIFQKKLQLLKESRKREKKNSFSSNSDTSVKDTSSSTELSNICVKLPTTDQKLSIHALEQPELSHHVDNDKRNVNPFKNLDGSKSVFVDKLVTPVLMVHTKNDYEVVPHCKLRDIPFKHFIYSVLKSMRIRQPKRLQTVSWNYIMRGHSFFMVSPAGNGKTVGYVPAVCNLVLDSIKQSGPGPLCIIVCATALSVTEVEMYCKKFLKLEDKILALHSGMVSMTIVTALLNGCHILISTPSILVQFLGVDFGVDLRSLMILVLEDCERLSQVYASELNTILLHVKATVKNRADKSAKVQYIVASRLWCDFMAPLAKKAPDTIIAIGASQECVLYSKTQTSVNYVTTQTNKVNAVIEFLNEIDSTKRTVIVCRADDEVTALDSTLTALKHLVFSCNSTMTLPDLYTLNEAWSNYQEPVLGPILICCDSNLPYLNVTDASYLIHFSLPALFSMFCKRFSVLNEHYASVFEPQNKDVKIKIFLNETNVEQLPKILHFIKRCTKEVFPMLDNVLQQVLEHKDLKKAEAHTEICNNLMMLGECADEWNCNDRHTIFKEFDEPKEWMPKQGIVKFLITRVDSAVTYTARVTGKMIKSKYTEYPNNYTMLRFDMQRYYTRDTNLKLHGIPKVGDICAANTKLNCFERCKVVEVAPGDDSNSYYVRIHLIDEQQHIMIKDIYLYHLPDNFKAVETYVVKVRLANIQPKDKDITYSVAAKEQISWCRHDRENKMIYMRGQVLMSLNDCIFVDGIEACIDLAEEDGGTIVKRNLKLELLSQFADPNLQHIEKLIKLSKMLEPVDEEPETESPRILKQPRWAHLDNDEFLTVHATAESPSTVFVRQTKFLKVVDLLINDIKEYVKITRELIQEEIYVGNIVLAEYPDDNVCERARIDGIVDDKKVKCFFVDSGDWRHVSINKLWPITNKIMHSVPFQAIECRLVGVKPLGKANDWSESSTNWLYENCFEDKDGDVKCLYVKYFTKEKATVTGGHKYGIVLIDTNSDQDVVVNKMMIELYLAEKNEDESKYFDESFKTSVKPKLVTDSLSHKGGSPEMNNSYIGVAPPIVKDLVPFQHKESESDENDNVLGHILFKKPIRSVPLVGDDDSDIDKWDISDEIPAMFGLPSMSLANYETENATERETSNTSEKKTIAAKAEHDTLSNEFHISNKKIIEVTSNCSESSSSAIKIENRVAERMLSEIENIVEKANKNVTLDSDDFSSEASEYQKPEAVISIAETTEVVEPSRKPKLIWRQNKKSVTLKVNLIGVENYALEIKERSLKFSTRHQETTYEFDLELYGVVKPEESVHSCKGQYIQVTLVKVLQRNWFNLTRDCIVKKWIVYDVDAIDLSSDEDVDVNNEALEAIKYNHNKVESASEDEDFADDVNFKYKP